MEVAANVKKIKGSKKKKKIRRSTNISNAPCNNDTTYLQTVKRLVSDESIVLPRPICLCAPSWTYGVNGVNDHVG